MEKKPWKIDVAVLCIFFVRDDCFAKSFAAVKEARPRKLLLWQDGPRNGRQDDLVGIQKCRDIAEDIDWDCEVYRMYNEQNFGCDPSTFFSHKWAFSIVDKCIVLEDDVVPDQSFFYFCKELLDRYENDERINRICGMNNVPGFECPDSYFFSGVGSVWGWATWKRVADSWDEEYSFLKDDYAMKQVAALRPDKSFRDYKKTCERHAATGKPHWETIQTYSRYLNHQLVIVPCRNLIKNVGLGENSTHSNGQLECIPKDIRESLYADSQTMEFPLKHPKYVMENLEYKEKVFYITGKNSFIRAKRLKLENIILRIKHIGFKETALKIISKLRKKR